MTTRYVTQRVPPRALGLSVAALIAPVAVVFWLPDWTSSGAGMLIWLTALIPAFLFAYYRGLEGVAVALAGGMAVISATQASVVAFDIAEPRWSLLAAIVIVYLAISVGIAVLAEVLRRERTAAEDMALLDRLTGLPNRRLLEESLARDFAAAERGQELTVVIFDLDHFKQVNDRHGHAAGDHALRAFAKVLAANTRKENLSARLGGEEFVSVLRSSDSDAAVTFAQRVLDDMRDFRLPWGAQTVSAGVAHHQKGMGSFEVLLAEADRALYQAKRGGRDMVCIAARQSPHAELPRTSSLSAATSGRRRGLIWVVDDDAALRSAARQMLAEDRHTLWDTGVPSEAIRRFADGAPAARPDLIITDVIMPEMSGMRMIEQIAAISPDVRVIYMSGYVQSDIDWQGPAATSVAFLEKPIKLDLLLDTVQRALETAPSTSR